MKNPKKPLSYKGKPNRRCRKAWKMVNKFVAAGGCTFIPVRMYRLRPLVQQEVAIYRGFNFFMGEA